MENIENLLSQKQQFTRAVVGYLITEDNEILLGLRKKVSNDLGPDLYAGIGGKVETDETNEQALKREVMEEIGVEVTKSREMGKVRFLFPHRLSWQQEVIIYIINEWKGYPVETETIRPAIFLQEALPFEQMWDDNSYWVPIILSGKKIDAVYLYDKNGKVIEEQISYLDDSTP